MYKLLVCSLFASSLYSHIIPFSLPPDISAETAWLFLIDPKQWEEVGYQFIERRLADAKIDNAGKIHLAVNERRSATHKWIYLCYDKDGKKLIEEIIYQGEYLTGSHTRLHARILVNPDQTILFFYLDAQFYTCWTKLDTLGNTISHHSPQWWRGDAQFHVCVAGQDSFHLFSWPYPFWDAYKTVEHPIFGSVPFGGEPNAVLSMEYSNNFRLEGNRVKLKWPYSAAGNIQATSLPNNKIFCFTNGGDGGGFWIMDNEGKTYKADVAEEGFYFSQLDDMCYSKVPIDGVLSDLSIASPFRPIWGDLALLEQNETSIMVGIFYENTLYTIVFDLQGKILQRGQGKGKLVPIEDLDHHNSAAFITQIIDQNRLLKQKGKIDKTIFYWGFDREGNFFLHVY